MNNQNGTEYNSFMLYPGTKYSGCVLVQRAAELIYMLRGKADWEEKDLRESPPMLIRYGQMLELMSILGIIPDFGHFEKGGFIMVRDSGVYENLLQKVFARSDQRNEKSSIEAVCDIFTILFSYRCSAYSLLRSCSGYLVGNVVTRYACGHIRTANQVLEEGMVDIDDILWEIVDPEKRVMTLGELGEGIKYLKYDVSEIDIAYM